MSRDQESDANINEFLNSFDESHFPEAFLRAYDIMECFSVNDYSETYLVLDKEAETYAVAKCYKRLMLPPVQEPELLQKLHHKDMPSYIGSYENPEMLCVIREYIEGTPLSTAAAEREFSPEQVLTIGISLCEILQYLHTQTPPIIHRDVKPENIILRPDGSVALIDFGISRAFRENADADTINFGTRSFSAPEQYGYAQTDCRSDLFSLGMVMGYLLTGSIKTDDFAAITDKPLARVIQTCTAFDPKDRYKSVRDCHRALCALQPVRRKNRKIHIIVASVLALAAAVIAGVLIYQAASRSVFDDENHVPAFITDETVTTQAADYMNEKYQTALFSNSTDIADIGYIRKLLIDVYGYDEAYANGRPPATPPMEVEDSFLPWNFEDDETIRLDMMVYFAVKIYWPEVVSDWSSLKDDTGEYPGIRVAKPFAEKNGIYGNVNRPDHLTVADVAVILYNADRAYGDGLPPQLMNVYLPKAKPVSTLGFTEPLIERAVRAALGKPETDPVSSEELASVEGLYIFANAVSPDQDGFYASAGDWYATGNGVKGDISSLADVKLLPNLRVICIAAQNIADISPIASLTGLEKVEFKHNKISDISVLADLPALASAGLNGNPLTDVSALGKCKGLRFLDLCDVRDYDPSFLNELGEFEFLDIANSTNSYAYLGDRKVRELKLGYTALDSLADLSGVTGLQSLEVKHSKLTSLSGIEPHTELTYLNIAHCAIDDLSPVLALPALQTLVISEDMRPALTALGDVGFSVSFE